MGSGCVRATREVGLLGSRKCAKRTIRGSRASRHRRAELPEMCRPECGAARVLVSDLGLPRPGARLSLLRPVAVAALQRITASDVLPLADGPPAPVSETLLTAVHDPVPL